MEKRIEKQRTGLSIFSNRKEEIKAESYYIMVVDCGYDNEQKMPGAAVQKIKKKRNGKNGQKEKSVKGTSPRKMEDGGDKRVAFQIATQN